MSHRMISGSQASLHYYSNRSLQPTKSMLERPSSDSIRLSSIQSHLPKPSFSLKSQFGSFRRIRTRPRASFNNFYVINKESYYDLLGVSESSSLSEIKQAYKQLERKYHRHLSPPQLKENHTKRFIQVQEAYETLCDPNARALYDLDMTQGLHGERPHRYEGLDEKSEWRKIWEPQLKELQRRSINKLNDKHNMSWATRIHRQRGAQE
ncbi:hypothetical protein REPUB_Repub12eG0081900 [Reevesia pubescens]